MKHQFLPTTKLNRGEKLVFGKNVVAITSVLLWVSLWSPLVVAVNDHPPRPLFRRTTAASPSQFEIIILAGSEPRLLENLFDSIATTDFLGDDISLKIKVSESDEEVADLAYRYVFPREIVKKEVLRVNNSGIGDLDSWLNAWPGTGESNALILDGNMDLSPLWYKYVKGSWNEYGGRSDLAGISLAKQAVTTSFWAPLRYMPIINENIPFLYGMIVGPSAFSPHPARWREFLSWVRSVDIDDLRSSVPNIATVLIELKRYEEIFFYHSRKAGGSTIGRWLAKLGEAQGKEVHLVENNICPSQYFYNENHPERAVWLYNDQFLSVTVLRDPVDRAVSSYNFEGRWGTGNIKIKDMKPEDEVSLDEYIDKTTSRRNECNSGKTCKYCTSECYCRWFGGDGRGGCDEAHALDVLHSFDMVIYTTDMKNSAFLRTIERIIDSKGIPIETKNVTPESKKKDSQVTGEHFERLESLNEIDTRIVESITGGHRETQVVQDWYKFLDEETMWSLWTQLFNYWCKMNDLYILHLSPHNSGAMAVSLSEDLPTDFSLVTDPSDFGEMFPKDLNKYRLDGSRLLDDESDSLLD